MALPSGINGKTLTFGRAGGFDGADVPSGARVAVTASKNVRHLTSGSLLVSGQMVRKFVDGVATFDELVPNDAPGLDRYDWTYQARFEIPGAAEQPQAFSFVLLNDGPDAIDGDTLIPVPSSTGTPISVHALVLPPGGVDGQVLAYADGQVVWADAPTGNGGGSVASVNGKVGTVVLDAGDVGAQPAGSYATTQALSDGLATKVNSEPDSPTWPPTVLPRVTITTASGADPIDTETYLDAAVTINGSQPFSGAAQVRGRGNTTWTDSSKKPWRIKLGAAAGLLGMPAERDWVLLANSFDPTKIRTAVAFEVGARSPGLAWTPRMRFVELTMNGTYRGIYQLGEHVEISVPNKMNVVKASGTTGLTLTGAYSMEIDKRGVESGDPGFTTAHGMAIAYDDPDGTTPAQATYIQQWITDFEAALFGASWLDPATGYARFIDMPSFVDWYIVNELLANLDSNGYSSIKLLKTRDTADTPGRLFLGPLWDFDQSAGNNSFGAAQSATAPWVTASTDGGNHPGFTWITRMLGDPAFFAMLVSRWATLRASLTAGDSIFAVIDRLTDRLAYAVARDQRKWSTTNNVPALSDAMKDWLNARIAWLNNRWVIDTTPPPPPTGVTATYTSFRFLPTALRVPGTSVMQYGEFELQNDSGRITGMTVTAGPGASYGSGEAPGAAADGVTASKFCNASGIVALFYTFPQAVTVTGYRLATANDSPERDPVSWTVAGSNDGGTTWTVIDTQTNYATPNAREAYTPVIPLSGN